MVSKQNLEVIREAINQLLVEEENGNSVDRRNLLSQLRSQLESLEEESRGGDISITGETMEELKKIKRQNLITHGLLSAMIVVTLSWQVSEVSLILKMKRVLSGPLESVGGIVKRFLNGQPKVSVEEVMKQAKMSLESTSIPQLEWPGAGLDTREEE